MWIKTSDRLPDTARKVFIRGTDRKDKTEHVAISSWWDFEHRWANLILFDNEYHTPDFESIAYWCEITDLLKLPIEGKQAEDSKIDVHVGLIPLGCSVIEMLDWALETTLESIAYAESNIRWNEAQDQSTDDATKWLEKSTKRYQRLLIAWERKTNAN